MQVPAKPFKGARGLVAEVRLYIYISKVAGLEKFADLLAADVGDMYLCPRTTDISDLSPGHSKP